ncbi:SusC/RagA family TonB-linked outer membrane protein [Larkinella bovis]|uniref:SusC/RagA family TonB-linked outer membrane protein n=1 Tax=Larkinella bovis TaxID=683041 RepID=A0ABW0IAD1_9BACT
MKKRILPAFFIGKRVFLLVALLCWSLAVSAQQARSVKGKVTDERNEGLPGVSIVVKGTTSGTTTDVNGQYTLNLPDDRAVLVFSFVGYVSQEIPVGGQAVLDVTLKGDSKTLNEVVVVGYGSQSRETLTTSISKIDNKVLENVPMANPASALQGSVSGVRVQSTSGQPGAAPRVIVRGGTSINNPDGAAPLYIIDGVIRTDLSDLNADEIESMQVLKDAASTAIYGARGSNGVVIVTTRRGKSGQARISYSYDLTDSRPGKLYKLANARDYLTINRLGVFSDDAKFGSYASRLTLPMGYGTGNDLTKNTAFTTQYLTPANQHKLNEGWQSMPDPADPTKTLIFQDTDFQSLLYQKALSHNHNLNISGGNDKSTFNVGLGYLKADGTVITTKYDRLSLNMSGELKVRDNLKITSSAIYSRASNNEPYSSTAVIFYRNAGLAPTAKLYFEDGTLAPGTNNAIGNPLYQMTTRVNENVNEKLTLSFGGRWDIAPGLAFEPLVSMYNTTGNSYNFQPGYWNGPTAYVDSRVASASSSKWLQYQVDGVFSYNKTFNRVHNLDARAGFAYYDRKNSALSASGRNASTDLIPTLNASGEAVSVSSSISKHVIMGYFASANYNYDMKYLVSVNMRYDGASNLGEAYKWGFFPGVSLGWNVHNEKFWGWSNNTWSQLKLRASYGVNGNISGLGDFTAQGAYGVGAKYAGAAAIQNTVIANKDLKWEQSKTFNIGTDLGFFNNRVTLIADVYNRVTDNLLTSLPLPNSTGFSSVLTNLGSLQNRGFDLELGARVLGPSSPVQWQLSFNASKTKNKILKLPYNGAENNRVGGYLVWDDAAQDYRWKGGLQEGLRMGEIYDRQFVRVYPTDEAAQSGPVATYIVGNNKKQYGGDVEYYDADKNGLIDSRDKTYMGNQFPVWTGGMANTVSYKNLSLYVRMDYTAGHTIFNWAKMFLDGNMYADGNLTQDMVDRSWKKQGDIAELPRSYWGGERVQRNLFDGTTTGGTSLYYGSGDFLALREITLSYGVPTSFLSKFKVANLRFNVTLNNIHYFTKYNGLNPEEGGKDDGRYALPKNIIFGAKLSF